MYPRLAMLCLVLCGVGWAAAQTPARQAFEIATGPIAEDLYLKGERLAGVVSHPPGASRCAQEDLCGPDGLIATARAAASPSQALLAIARGELASALAPVDVAAAMRLSAGKGKQNQSRLRAIAVMGHETVYLIAAAKSRVTGLATLKGRWTGIGVTGGRTRIVADALLAAGQLKRDSLRTAPVEGDEAAKLMRARRLDAFIWVGAALPASVQALLTEGVARKVYLQPRVVDNLMATNLGYVKKVEGAGDGATTVAIPIAWLVDERKGKDLVFAVARAALNPLNRPELDTGAQDPASLRLSQPSPEFPIPLHPGAQAYFAAIAKPSN